MPDWENSKTKNKPIKVKVVIVTMFERGVGEGAGEFQHWQDRQGLKKCFPFPQSHHDIYMNEETGILGIVTGMGTSRSSSAVMALGLDPRFDFTKAYWLVAGIAGGDPQSTSLGSAVWARYLVDCDYAHHVDPREIPDDWETGFFPLFSKKPYDKNRPESQSEVFELNADLLEWAYQLTKHTELENRPEVKQISEQYQDFSNALQPPSVIKGDNLSGMTFWHGKLLNDFANKWVKYWTDGKGEFVTAAMEDTGTYQSLDYLTRAGKADVSRFMVLRTVSNYTMQPVGISAVDNLLKDINSFVGMDVALESAYQVGSKVVDAIVDNWEVYQDSPPKF